MDVLNALLPLVAVFLGAGITYWLNVRSRRRTKVEDVFHDALAAVAVAAASRNFLTELTMTRAVPSAEQAAVNAQIGREGQLNFARAVADARAAIARASAYDPALSVYYRPPGIDEPVPDIVEHSDEILARLRDGLRRAV